MEESIDKNEDDRVYQRIKELESELRELQHRAKNSLQLVVSLLKLQSGRIRDPDARAAYEQTLLRIGSLTSLYQQLHESGSGTHLDLGRYVKVLCETLSTSTFGKAAEVNVNVDSDPIQIGLYEAMPLGLIIVELVSNSLRRVHPIGGLISVSVRKEGGGRARLTVEDNGQALHASFDPLAEDELMLAEALAAQLGDALESSVSDGNNRSSVSFPI
ncbi:sensor histidine kinase [Azospirillum argentinense]|uniref:sensor histidine kinase n=1 Tax=Azospirillum argentinense TaxID=2970906 RepID=UPI0009DE1FB6|nr:histidine kinase dimerization/phosphoacceptor domain -containing protein [Azospirillum argentinense]